MAFVQSIKNKFRRVVQYYGTEKAKRNLWNTEFSRGDWNCLDKRAGDCVYSLIEKYARHGSILDLGCGSGSTGSELSPASYSEYVGVDISDVAVDKAIERTLENGRSDKNRYFQSDISSYMPDQQFDMILLRDSVYYVPPSKVQSLLNRYSLYLKPGGVFIVRMYDGGEKYKATIEIIKNNFAIKEERLFEQPSAVVFVFS